MQGALHFDKVFKINEKLFENMKITNLKFINFKQINNFLRYLS